jgi:hypothetical protein
MPFAITHPQSRENSLRSVFIGEHRVLAIHT